ncbi:MAG: hypothetical protein OXC46_01450 [Thaumarchaeota archaeon]|nr:hypothetical protein [Nitrososphaerota archaeon]
MKNMMESQNQLGNKHPDSDIIFNIKKYLRKEHHIRASQILIECRILFHNNSYDIFKPQKKDQPRYIRGLTHTPDITVVNDEDDIVFIVEQDGKIHDLVEFTKKDKLRNYHYTSAGIPYIILKSSQIRSNQICMAECLDSELERLGLRKPAGLHL